MKPIQDWEEADLQALVDQGVQESLELDYKQSAALTRTDKAKNDISKDVSAFANSNGGRIVYGVIEKKRAPAGLDSGCDPAVISREWVEQVINSSIHPRLQGVRVKEIRLQSGGSAFVVDVPRAVVLAPHQASDQKYYRRFNFESVPMFDYEIRDAMRRASAPHLVLTFSPRSVPGQPNDFQLKVEIKNLSAEPALYTVVEIFIDGRIAPGLVPGFEVTDESFLLNGQDFPMKRLRRLLLPTNHMPIFQETKFTLCTLPVRLTENLGGQVVAYRVSSPGFLDARHGLMHVADGKMTVSVDTPLPMEEA